MQHEIGTETAQRLALEVSLTCGVHNPPKVYTFSFIVGNVIPKSVECIHSATKFQFHDRIGAPCVGNVGVSCTCILIERQQRESSCLGLGRAQMSGSREIQLRCAIVLVLHMAIRRML